MYLLCCFVNGWLTLQGCTWRVVFAHELLLVNMSDSLLTGLTFYWHDYRSLPLGWLCHFCKIGGLSLWRQIGSLILVVNAFNTGIQKWISMQTVSESLSLHTLVANTNPSHPSSSTTITFTHNIVGRTLSNWLYCMLETHNWLLSIVLTASIDGPVHHSQYTTTAATDWCLSPSKKSLLTKDAETVFPDVMH